MAIIDQEAHPNDNDLHDALYPMRPGLCIMLADGRIDNNRAVDTFEGIRNSLVEYKRLEKQVEKGNDI